MYLVQIGFFPKPNPQLTPEETQRKQECVNTWTEDHKKGSGEFWTGNTQYVRHTHHTNMNSYRKALACNILILVTIPYHVILNNLIIQTRMCK